MTGKESVTSGKYIVCSKSENLILMKGFPPRWTQQIGSSTPPWPNFKKCVACNSDKIRHCCLAEEWTYQKLPTGLHAGD